MSLWFDHARDDYLVKEERESTAFRIALSSPLWGVCFFFPQVLLGNMNSLSLLILFLKVLIHLKIMNFYSYLSD